MYAGITLRIRCVAPGVVSASNLHIQLQLFVLVCPGEAVWGGVLGVGRGGGGGAGGRGGGGGGGGAGGGGAGGYSTGIAHRVLARSSDVTFYGVRFRRRRRRGNVLIGVELVQ